MSILCRPIMAVRLRSLPGMKRANPDIIGLAYMGDGGGYAIGSQHLFNAAVRNERITIILCNNCNYGMTGGQMAPTYSSGHEDRNHSLRP